MDSKKIWIDISHIISWKGNLTGIERVEYHLIEHYYSKPQAEFIIWKGRKKSFNIVKRDYVKTTIVDRASEKELQHKVVLPTRNPVKRVYRRLKRRPVPIKRGAVTPGVVIVLAGLWDNKGYIDGLRKLSKTHHLLHIVYDMIPVVQHGYVINFLHRVFKKYTYAVLPFCKGVLAISESTANDVTRALQAKKLKVPEVRVFHLGDDITRAARAKKPKGLKKVDNFILSVGTVEARKNHKLLYYAQKQLLHAKKPITPIVVVGRMGWLSSDFQHMAENDAQTRDNLILLEMVTDSELKWLYENCLFTIFPSFYEGWGLPITESLGYGKVTLTSNTSSMPEAGGILADYFSPFSADQLADLITKYTDNRTRLARERIIQKEYKPLSWEDSAAQFEEIVRQLVVD